MFSASNNLTDPLHPRLTSATTGPGGEAWRPTVSDENQWIRVNLVNQVVVVGFKMVADNNCYYGHTVCGNQWVTHLQVSYSEDGIQWNSILNEEGSPKVCPLS